MCSDSKQRQERWQILCLCAAACLQAVITRTFTMVTQMRPAWVAGPVSPLTVFTCIHHGCLLGEGEGKSMLKAKIAKTALPMRKCFHCFPLFTGELLSQPRPEGLTEIICPKNGSERVNVALVYPPTPTVISPCSK